MVSSEPHNLCHVLEAFVSGVPTSLSHGTFYSGRFRVLLRKQLVSTHIKPLAVVLIDDTLGLSTGFLRACSRGSRSVFELLRVPHKRAMKGTGCWLPF